MEAAAQGQNRTVTVITPENITVTYQLAGVITRSAAMILDLLIQVLLIVLLSILVDTFRNVGFGIDHLVSFVGFIASFCVMFVYNIFFEMVWGGRTPGKRVFGLRVIRDGGFPINIVSSCIRNILRFVDLGIVVLPTGSVQMLYALPGVISVFVSNRYKRIGDYAAGTLVIHEQSASPFAALTGASAAKPEIAVLLPLVKNLDRMSVDEYRIVRRFTSRRATLLPAVQAGVSESIARPLLDKLEIRVDIRYQVQYADILEAIERRYAEEHGIL